MERKWAIVVAVILGILAVLLTNVYFRQKEAQFQVEKGEEAQVLVAANDITKGSLIDYEMLAFKAMPVKFIEPGALGSRAGAVGKAALVTIKAGEQILANKLAAPGTGLTLAVKTPPGKRAFTITLDATEMVGGMIEPQDHVDVLAVFSNPAITLTLFQDVLVLAVGQKMVPTERKKKEGAASGREAITLALTPQEVQVLSVAMEQGKIRLTLRPRMEVGKAIPTVDLSNLPPAVDVGTILGLYIRRPPAPPGVEIIRGSKKEMTTIPAR